MWAAGTGELYRRVLAAPHRRIVRVEVLDGSGVVLEPKLRILGGQVQATLGSQVTRKGKVEVPWALVPQRDTDLLAPMGNQLAIHRGVEFGDGQQVWFPQMVGRINDVDGASLEVVDVAGELGDAGFEVPTSSRAGDPTLSEFRRLVSDGYPQAVFGPCDELFAPVPEVTWESDRAKALDDLAAAVGAFWYTRGDGRFVLRRIPWLVAPAADQFRPVLADGPGGLVTDSKPRMSRGTVYNGVTVLGERADGGEPVRWTALDSDPASPTRWGGPFGRKLLQVQLQTAATPAQARTTGEAYLARAKALTESWTLTCVPDPSLELGDVATVQARGRTSVQVLAGITMPLDVDGSMQLTTRALVPGPEVG